jgi:ferritin-like metal-binding protein YciE
VLDDMPDRTKVENPKELFVQKLGAALTMETTVDELLGTLVDKASDPPLKQQLRHHREETQAQLRNLHQAFSTLGMEAKGRPCPAIEGIAKESESNLGMAAESLHDAIILAGAAETEHYEIAVYENLIVQATALGYDDIVALLHENLEQEQQTLGEVVKATVKQAQRENARA